MAAARLEEEAGEKKASGGDGAERTLGLDDGHETRVGIVQRQEVIDVRFHALRGGGGEPFVELLFHLVEAVLERPVDAIGGLPARHQEAEEAGGCAMLIEVDIAGAREVCLRCRAGVARRRGCGSPALWRIPPAPECFQCMVWKGHIFSPGSRRMSLPARLSTTMSSSSWSKSK